MIKIFTLTLLSACCMSIINAQIDQISVGPNYSEQAYYSLSTGAIETVSNESWDIAFSAEGQQDAGVILNESVTFMSTPMQVFLADTDDWAETINSTNLFVDSVSLHNPDINWTEGAFNTVKDPSSPFDFGWGAYNPQTNIVEGTKIFVIKKRDASFVN